MREPLFECREVALEPAGDGRTAIPLAVAVAVFVACLLAPAAAQAQTRLGRIIVTVTDQSGLVIPDATVTVSPQDGGTVLAGGPRTARTSGLGAAVVGDLPDGRYAIQVEFPGFQTAVVRDVRVRGRDERRRVTLQIQRVTEDLTVSRDRQSSALDPKGSAFSTVMTREQIDALPDDPEQMEEVLKAMAPPGSVLRVDGFTGGRLPPKSQIRSIRLPRMDMFAAQNHGGMSGMLFIDIMTMPGMGPMRGSADVNVLDEALNARNAFTPVKADEQVRLYNFSLSGTIRPNRTSFSINGGGGSQYTSPSLLAVLPDGTTATDTLRQPRTSVNASARVDHALTKDHAARLGVDVDSGRTRNLGVGGYNLFERAYTARTTNATVRISENGPIGRRYFTESRVQLRWTRSESESAVESPTLRVLDAFTSGGAQQRGGQRGFAFEVASDLDYVRGAHSWRTGVLLEGGSFRSDDVSNYLGTYTFASLADYHAGKPAAYSRRIGAPDVTYSTLQAAVYVQDDFRVSRSLLLTGGLRYGVQDHLSDRWNLSPRATFAWSPFRSGTLTVRGSYGYFYDWVAGDLYKQTLLVDGLRQRELNVLNPAYPYDDAGAVSSAPTNRYLWSDDLSLPNAHRMNLGVERTLSANSRLSATYSRGWGRGLLRGRNLNVPVGGVRPDPSLANDVALVADAASRSQSLGVSFNVVRMDWKRTFFAANYTWSRNDTNTGGAFSLPATRDDLEAEWGPASNDVRHRLGGSLGMQPVRNLSCGLNVRVQSGMPYNVTTGRDDNADGVFNDRPAGTSRNSERGGALVDLGGRISYAWGFGKPRQATGPGGATVAIRIGDSGGLGPGFGGGAEDKRVRLEVYVSGQNLLNRVNYLAYSFVRTSPFYGRPVAAWQPRRLQVGARVSF